MTSSSRIFQSIFFYALLLAVGVLVLAILWPYLDVLILAMVLAIVLHPIYLNFVKWFRGSRGFAALVTLLLCCAVLGVPFALLGFRIFQESKELYTQISTHRAQYIDLVNQTVTMAMKPYFPDASFDVSDYFQQSANWFFVHFGDVFSQTAQFFIRILLGVIALFYLLRDGERFKNMLVAYSPLPDKHDREIIERLQTAVHSVLMGSVSVALIQGCMSGFGFWLFGVPNPAVWGSVAAMSALIPGFGTSLVLTPAILYLFLTGETSGGIGLLFWSVLAVGLIDNALAPFLVGRKARIHPLFVLFSVIGGVGLFGPLGFIFGPLAASLFLALLGIYKTYFNGGRSTTRPSRAKV